MYLPWIFQEWLCEFESQSYSFHALEGKQLTHPVKIRIKQIKHFLTDFKIQRMNRPGIAIQK